MCILEKFLSYRDKPWNIYRWNNNLLGENQWKKRGSLPFSPALIEVLPGPPSATAFTTLPPFNTHKITPLYSGY